MSDDKKLNALREPTVPYCCPTCWDAFGTQAELALHAISHTSTFPAQAERLFLFATHSGQVIPYNEKHALVFGFSNPQHFKEYLGMIETSDNSILQKTVEEVRAMDLPKMKPREVRKTVVVKGVERTYNKLEDVL